MPIYLTNVTDQPNQNFETLKRKRLLLYLGRPKKIAKGNSWVNPIPDTGDSTPAEARPDLTKSLEEAGVSIPKQQATGMSAPSPHTQHCQGQGLVVSQRVNSIPNNYSACRRTLVPAPLVWSVILIPA